MNATLIEEYCDLVENGADFDGPGLRNFANACRALRLPMS
jgi:hypothetical protein